ncbi:replication factor A subunit protein RFA1 [Sugiyamaella lignohabitans]|uniref:Replication protein A subunit n=1 Tax=Sugiyamaella lignohabitans TaxID=796027 RepID=A0A167C4L4_9ASCO|nr:replication factor A subunit protein RFA1 [Sugiyamaella lignohabitans]ANB11209.1 replication factor A subunit protein RFA1 [Sugiyamaella lignohabitans]
MTELTVCFAEFGRTSNPSEVVPKFPQLKLQVLKVKLIQGAEPSQNRMRLTVSDGVHYSQAIVNLNEEKGGAQSDISVGSVIEVKSYDSHRLQTGKIVFVLYEWDVVGVESPIGHPTSLEANTEAKANDSMSPAPAPVAPVVAPPAPAPVTKPKAKPAAAPGNFTAIIPIDILSPYHNKWTIRARVSNKSDIRTFTNARGEGKLFNVTLVDESGEIRATGFSQQVDAFYDLLQEGKVYYISKCRVQVAKKQFSNVQNDFELVFDRDSQIELCTDEVDVPKIKFDFTSIKDLGTADINGTVDFIGVLKSINPAEQITSKNTGRPYDKRDVVLVDEGDYSIRATFWGKSAVDFSTPLESVIAIKGAKISDFNGRNISILNSSTVSVDPDVPEAHALKGWYSTNGRDKTFEQLPGPSGATSTGNSDDKNRTTIEKVISDQLGMTDQTDYFTIKGTISYIRNENMWYPSCTNADCNKKVIQDTTDEWRCEKCNITIAEPNYRYIISMIVSDSTGQIWVSSFDDIGNIVIGMSAKELYQLQEQDLNGFTEVITKALYKEYVLRCRARKDNYNDQVSVRYSAVRCTPVDYAHETQLLLQQLGI